MIYTVHSGDTLWRIAAAFFGRAEQWPTIAQDNRLQNQNRILVGQKLFLRDSMLVKPSSSGTGVVRLNSPQTIASPFFEHAPSIVPSRGFFFILADEINPFTRKVVRKVMVNPEMANALSQQLGKPIQVMANPSRFGLMPTDPFSPLPAGRHALGMKPSAFSSASNSLFGSSRIQGNRFWIDVAKAEAAGATFHGTEEIVADLNRIAAKSASSAQQANIARITNLVRADAEVLVRGPVPASAIKGAGAMALTRGLQGVQIVGFAMTAVDLTHATQKSIAQNSAKPIVAETIRQAGGWAAGWAGMKLGAAGGALVGIETGPGAIVTGLIGGVAGGMAGYFGFDWIADHIDAN
jgi:LysM repeat protein